MEDSADASASESEANATAGAGTADAESHTARADSERSGRFGDFLRAHAALPDETLERAASHQQHFGGRLGTCLVEIGALELEQLAELLARFHGAQQPPADWVEQPEDRALQMVPRSLLRRHGALPLRIDDDTLHIATTDPSDEDVRRALEKAAGCALKLYLLPEVRLVYWLEVHLGIDRHPRFVNLTTRARRRGLEADFDFSNTSLASEGDAAISGSQMPGVGSLQPAAAPSPLEEIVLDEIAEDASLQTAPPSSDAAPSGSPHRLAELEAILEGAATRNDIARAALALAGEFAEAVGLFFVHREQVRGFRARGEGIAERIGAFEVPVSTPSVLTMPAWTHNAFRGCPPPDGIDGEYFQNLGRAHAREMLIHPVRVAGRTLNLLYADNGLAPLGDIQAAALRQLCLGIGQAYERLLLKKRQR